MNVGAFVCGCGGACDVDLEAVREDVEGVDVVATSELLCDDGLNGMAHVVEEYELDQLLVTASDENCKNVFRDLAVERGLHPDAVEFVDHREGAAWVHDREAATTKTARLLNAANAGLAHEAPSRTVRREAGDEVVVVGDAETAATLADTADVTLVADGREFAGADADLDDVTLARGEVVAVEGTYGEFEVTLASRVTEACISCLECVKEGPPSVTARPVQIPADAPDGEWTDCCPTDAIEMDGVTRTVTADQVIHPAGTGPRGGKVGYYTGIIDGATVAAVESRLGGIEKPQFLDLEMDVCAAGESSQRGCTACTDACPHDAVDRVAIDEVSFDLTACQDCGACTSSCPTGAVQLRDPSNERLAREVEAMLSPGADDGGLFSAGDDGGIDRPVVAFTCSERAADRLREYGRRGRLQGDVTYPPVLPVRVNCTDTVGEAHVLHALAAGADGVAVVGCGDRCLHSGPDPKTELVERLNRATKDLGLGPRVEFFAPGPDPEPFCTDLESFVAGLDDTGIPAGDHEATGGADVDPENPPFDNHSWALESVRVITDHVDPDHEVIRGLTNFGIMAVDDDACNLTPTCSNLCPPDAIRRTGDGELQFNHERCVNCGLCESGCPETAITMHDGLALSLLPENRDDAGVTDDSDRTGDDSAWKTVHEGELQECVRCGTPFASKGSIETVREKVGERVDGIAPDSADSIFEYCDRCRSRLMFEGSEMR